MSKMPGRDQYMKEWSKRFGLDNNADASWGVCEQLVNGTKNYDTACAVMFDLSWAHHREYLERASAELKQYASQYPNNRILAQDLYNWVVWYETDKEKNPNE
jgi:hypothetical protein